eukprot:Nitzschia sp. Nitz4//scaffold27_size158506//135998//137458//NITZ4_002622-RA/size158506-processed-gene-0.90-mRNA-1//-1//CDS//3329545554//5391//frame0
MTPHWAIHLLLVCSILLHLDSVSCFNPIGFYVHIPYCRQRCRYCNFAIVPVGGSMQRPSSTFAKIHKDYQTDLLSELEYICRQEKGNHIPLTSVYFGGGTPSLAPLEMIQTILHRITNASDSPFHLLPNAEITMEMDPGTFTMEYLAALKDMGVNRISLGVQSFHDDILQAMGRVHRQADIMESLSIMEQVYGDGNCHYTLDLISGAPGLTLPRWIQTLQKATTLSPKPAHLSVYDLQLEQGTVFDRWYGETLGNSKIPKPTGIPDLPDSEAVAQMYKYTAGYLRAKGYEHYEVSSYAKIDPLKSRRSQHNQIYWAPNGSWYAIGLGATDSIRGQLTQRPKSLPEYHSWVAKLESSENHLDVTSTPSADDILTDIILKRLRTSDGLDLQWVGKTFGTLTVQKILHGASLGLELDLAERITIPSSNRITQQTNSDILRLTDPIGFLFSNNVISSIFAELGYV